MEPLSCQNCCHEPLRVGIVGTSFGYCTRHDVVLPAPAATTCGQLFRKDLLVESARAFRTAHARRFSARAPVALWEGAPVRVEKPNGQLGTDAVGGEARAYTRFDRGSKIGSLAALRRIPGIRAEVALHSLSRAWVTHCWEASHRWTAGLHVLAWGLERVAEAPAVPEPAELHDTTGIGVSRALSIARWHVLALRLYVIADIGTFAARARDHAGVLSSIADDALGATEPGDGEALLRWLGAHAARARRALPEKRYLELAKELRRPRA